MSALLREIETHQVERYTETLWWFENQQRFKSGEFSCYRKHVNTLVSCLEAVEFSDAEAKAFCERFAVLRIFWIEWTIIEQSEDVELFAGGCSLVQKLRLGKPTVFFNLPPPAIQYVVSL